MKWSWLMGFLLLIPLGTRAQFRPTAAIYPTSAAAYLYDGNLSASGGRWGSDAQTYSRYSSPWLTQWPGTTAGQAYWLGSTTTQSFNKGKFGTIYYYDMLGNMRYSRTFIDIAGKNRRGLKLLLPTINQRMFSQH